MGLLSESKHAIECVMNKIKFWSSSRLIIKYSGKAFYLKKKVRKGRVLSLNKNKKYIQMCSFSNVQRQCWYGYLHNIRRYVYLSWPQRLNHLYVPSRVSTLLRHYFIILCFCKTKYPKIKIKTFNPSKYTYTILLP